MSKSFLSNRTLGHVLPYILMVASIIGFFASLVLTYDKIQVLQNSEYQPTCNINPILSCGSVMSTSQSEVLGMPNTLFGLIAFTALFSFSVMLASGAKVKPWVWKLAQVAATVGVIFMHYLFFQSVFRVQAICPWCFVVWMITIPIFWYITLYNLREGYIQVSTKLQGISMFMQRHHGDILFVWYFVILAIIAKEFWYYWSTLI